MQKLIGVRGHVRASKAPWRIAVFLLVFGWMASLAQAQISVDETGLHDGAVVYGIDASSEVDPVTNSQIISLLAAGEVNAMLYADVTFTAYGIFSDPNSTNSGNITAQGIGGNADGLGNIYSYAALYGIYTEGTVNNSGTINVDLTGGEADAANLTIANAQAHASVYGIHGQSALVNTGDVDATATGGSADIDGFEGAANASGYVYGLYANVSGATLSNQADVDVDAVGGSASGINDFSAGASADGTAYALIADNALDNSGMITTRASGGSTFAEGAVEASAYSRAFARGLLGQAGPVTNSGAVVATATGGVADANSILDARADATANAYAIAGADIDNTGVLTVTALGGAAEATTEALASADANGIYGIGDSLTNRGIVAVAATGGIADANDYARANARANGLFASGAATFNNGALTVTTTGGTADADDTYGAATANAYAFGVNSNGPVENSRAIEVEAAAGQAGAYRAEAEAEAYGVYSSYDLIANSGLVDVMALGGSATSATTSTEYDTRASGIAYGLLSEDGAIENTADITAAAVGGVVASSATNTEHELFANAWAYGLSLSGSIESTYPDRHVDNSSDVIVHATGGTATGSADEVAASARAYGIDAQDALIDNTGNITATATGGTAQSSSNDAGSEPGAYSNAWAYAIRSEDGTVHNSGSLTATATGGAATGQGTAEASARAEVYGLYVHEDPEDSADRDVYNHATVAVVATGGSAVSAADDADASVTAYGLSASAADVDNTGDITVTAMAGSATAGLEALSAFEAYGLRVADAELNNAGDVTVVARSGAATGQTALAGGTAVGLYGSGGLTNSGDIVTVIEAEGISGTDNAIAGAEATGIYAREFLNNSGDIAVTADMSQTTATLSNVGAYGIRVTNAEVNNNADLSVTATAPDGFSSRAYGIYVDGNSTLTNTGIVRATGDIAYELHVDDNASVTLVDTYNVTLDGDPDAASIYVGENATLALNDATLTVAGVSREIRWDTPYRLFELGPNGAVDGNFVETTALNPNTTATYHDQNSASRDDDRVTLSYTPGASTAPPSAAVEKQMLSQALDTVNTHMTSLMLYDVLSGPGLPLLADAGPTQRSLALAQSGSDTQSGVFIEPYYSRLERDADPMGYDASLWGFAAGYERRIENTFLALHMGYGRSDIDYSGAGYSPNSEDQDILTGGVSALTRWDEWTLRYGLTGFYGWHDYEGLTGLALDERETGSTESYGTVATIMAGHIFRHRSHVFLPEAGLNWIWAHRQRYTTEATDAAWDTTYSAMDDHDLQAEAALRWLSSFMADDVHVSPSISIGVRHLLTDAEATATQSIPGTAPVLVKSERDRTAMTLAGSVVLSKSRRALSLAYDGEYSDDTQRHSAWLRYSWQF